jgi:hypothetical protein
MVELPVFVSYRRDPDLLRAELVTRVIETALNRPGPAATGSASSATFGCGSARAGRTRCVPNIGDQIWHLDVMLASCLDRSFAFPLVGEDSPALPA